MTRLYTNLTAAALLIALLAALWWAHERHAAGVIEDAVLAERKVWADAQIIAQARHDTHMAAIELRAAADTREFLHASSLRIAALEAGNARLTARAGSLQRAAESYRAAVDRAAAESPGAAGLAHAAREAGELLAACGQEYAGLGKEVERLATKVTDLQGYVREVVGPVCVAGQTEE